MLLQQKAKTFSYEKEKEQTVTLVVPKYGMTQEFGIQHAERLLDMGTALMVDGNYLKIVIIFTTKKMALELNQIKQILQKPTKRQTIQKAVNMQRRLRFHTETNIAVSDINQPTTIFLDWVRQLLPKDKYNIFLHLFKFPLPTPAVVEDVYRELERVFYSRNSSSSYQFTDSELAEDWSQYKKNNLNEPEIWKTTGWKRMQVSPNSILVVDLPQIQSSAQPEPYFIGLRSMQ